MKRRELLISAFGIAAISPISEAFGAEITNSLLIGMWSGKLALGSQALRLRLEFTNSGEINLYSIDQGSAPIKGVAKSLISNEISLEFPKIGAKFKGALNNSQINGTFEQGRNTIPLLFYLGADTGFTAEPKPAPLTQAKLDEIRAAANSPALIAAGQMRAKNPIIMVSGNRSANADVKATIDDKWHIGSIAKSMTSVLCARLIEKGILNWDTKIIDVLGALIPNMHEVYKQATVLHLMSHRSGLPGNIPIIRLLAFRASKAIITEDRIAYAKIALRLRPIGTIGERFEYSNNGYVILGTMLEVLTRKSFEELLVENLFIPLGLNSAGFGPPGTINLLDQPLGHSNPNFNNSRKPAGLEKSEMNDNPAVLSPAGRVHASASDMLKYMAAHRDYNPMLSRASWEKLHSVHFGGNYACGLIRRPDGSLWHNGSNTLWYAEIIFNPQTGQSAFACANDGFTAKSATPVGEALLSLYSN